jgi:phage-related protein
MSFYGSSFIFDGIQSELYDLRIYNFEISDPTESPSGAEATIREQWLYRREVPYFYGRFFEVPLEFDFTVGSFSPIDGEARHSITSWLLGRSTYLPLQIVQDDIENVFFNVIFTISPKRYVGNLNYSISLHARCDRPWAIQYPQTFSKTYTDNEVNDVVNYYNASAYNGYNKPTITFQMNNNGGYFSLLNYNDNDRIFRFDSLSPAETITVDNDRGIITSSLGLKRLSSFNKNFFRLIQGTNSIFVSGNIANLSIDSVFAKGIGG